MPTIRRKVLAFEQLESRQMLDGNVTAAQVGNTLYVTGSGIDNAVLITTSAPNVIKVMGVNTIGAGSTAAPTHINGAASASFQSVANLSINFGTPGANFGADSLVLSKLNLGGSVHITAGNGNTFIGIGDFDNSTQQVDAAANSYLGAVSLAAGLTVNMGSGTNTILTNHAVFRSATGQSLTITSGSGQNTYAFHNSAIQGAATFADTGSVNLTFDNTTAGQVTDTSGSGNSTFTFTHSSIVWYGTSITTSGGNDAANFNWFTGGSLSLALGSGTDQVTATNCAITDFTNITGGQGADTVSLSGYKTGSLNVNLGSEANTLSLTWVTIVNAAALTAGTGTEADIVMLTHVTAGSLAMNTGAGDDQVVLKTVSVNKGTSIDTGAGDDLVAIDGFSAAELQLTLESGHDYAFFEYAWVGGTATIDGGDGVNEFANIAGNTFGNLVKTSMYGFYVLPSTDSDPLYSGGSVLNDGHTFQLFGSSGNLLFIGPAAQITTDNVLFTYGVITSYGNNTFALRGSAGTLTVGSSNFTVWVNSPPGSGSAGGNYVANVDVQAPTVSAVS
jgi:hypothetical protein